MMLSWHWLWHWLMTTRDTTRGGLLVIAGLGAGLGAALLAAPAAAIDVPPLVDAAKQQRAEAVGRLLDEGADVNARQPDGATALHWAVHWDDAAMVDALLDAGADPTLTNDLGVAPLWIACRNGRAALITRLLDAGADPNQPLPSGETPLMTAASRGTVVGVEALLAHGADANASEDTHGQTALMWAVANRHPEVVQRMIDAGADPTTRTTVRDVVLNRGGSRNGAGSRETEAVVMARGGSSPLLFAARSGDAESARLLLDAGADANDRAPDGTSVLVVAAHSGSASVAATLVAHGAGVDDDATGYTALHAAVLRADLLDRGIPNPDPMSGLPLVRALLDAGADPNARLREGTPVRRWSQDFAFHVVWRGATPLWLAARFLETEMVEVLLDAGADPRRTLDDGTTPIMAAAGHGWSRSAGDAFLKDRRDFSSYNPVASAELATRVPPEEEAQVVDAVGALLEHGADVTPANEAGDTALHAAASHGMNRLIEFLVSRGADVNASNERGQTPLARAVRGAGIGVTAVRDETATLLRQLGARE